MGDHSEDRMMQNTYRYYPGKFSQFKNRWTWSDQMPLSQLVKDYKQRNTDGDPCSPEITHVIKAGNIPQEKPANETFSTAGINRSRPLRAPNRRHSSNTLAQPKKREEGKCWVGWKEPRKINSEVLKLLGIQGTRRRLPIHVRNP